MGNDGAPHDWRAVQRRLAQSHLSSSNESAAAYGARQHVRTLRLIVCLLRYADTLRRSVAEQQLAAAEGGGGPQSGKRGEHPSAEAALLDVAALQHVAEELAIVEQIVIAGTLLSKCSC